MTALDRFMGRKRLFRISGDVREHPRYSVQEAAEYLHMPASTLKAWTRGQDYIDRKTGKRKTFESVIEAADPKNKLLSFYNLAEAHLLRSTIERDIPLANLRKALEYLREHVAGKHPLLRKDFRTYGKKIFLTELGETINITSPQGNLFMESIFDEYLLRLEWDEAELMPMLIYPIGTNRLVINPLISSGKPVIKGTGVMVSILLDRHKIGESIPDLANDYGIQPFEIEEAIKEFAQA
jgi:uncharacterized protein (DUF433 family)